MSRLRRFSNNALITTLAAPMTNSDLTASVSIVSGFPNTPFAIRVDNEIMLVTDVTGSVFTVERGYDNTAKQAHILMTDVEHVAIADDFQHLWQEELVSPKFGYIDDEFDDGVIGSEWYNVTPSGTATWTEDNGIVSALVADQSSTQLTGLVKSMDGIQISGVKLVTAMRLFYPSNQYLFGGLVFSDGTTVGNSLVTLSAYTSNTGLQLTMRGGQFNGVSTTLFDVACGPQFFPWLYLRLSWLTSDLWSGEFSPDGVTWTDLNQGNQTHAITPTYMGMVASTWGNTTYDGIASFDFFRVYEQ